MKREASLTLGLKKRHLKFSLDGANAVTETSAITDAGRLEELLKICRAIASFQNTSFLAASLPDLLRPVLDCKQVNLYLYDQDSDRLTRLPVQSETPGQQSKELLFAASPLSSVWLEQKPLLTSLVECRSRYADVAPSLTDLQDGIYCMVPLCSSLRCLGGLEVICDRMQPFLAEDLYVLQTISLASAETLEAITERERARRAYADLQQERVNDHVLVEVTNAVIDQLDLHKLLEDVSNSLRIHFGLTFVGMELRPPNPDGSPSDGKEVWEAHVFHCLDQEGGIELRSMKGMENSPLGARRTQLNMSRAKAASAEEIGSPLSAAHNQMQR